MKDWGKELFDEWADKKFIPDVLEEVRKATGYDGEFNIKYKPWYSIHTTPEMVAYKDKTGKLITEISIKKPKLRTNSPWDLFFYCWSLMGEALHVVDVSRSKDFTRPATSERKVHLTALYMAIRYMRNNYTTWYRENRRVLDAIRRELTHLPVG